MSRLTDKIDKVRSQMSDLEDQLDELEDKQRRSNFKKDRKRHRKWIAKNMATYRFAKKFEGLLYKDSDLTKHVVFSGIGEQIGA